jgi:hypothetical protein
VCRTRKEIWGDPKVDVKIGLKLLIIRPVLYSPIFDSEAETGSIEEEDQELGKEDF